MTTAQCAAETDPAGRTAVSIVASVLPADLSRLGDEVEALAAAGVDGIQWDVMDGVFVPNLTFGPDVIAACRGRSPVAFEAHLMVQEPDLVLERYADAGCETLIVHAEACTHLHRVLTAIRALGTRAGVALNPATPLEAVRHVVDLVDLLVIMTVNPGFGGQAYLASMEPKIAEAAALVAGSGHPIALEVDGGISPRTAPGAVAAGAGVLVSGSSLYRAERLDLGVAELRSAGRLP